MGELGTLQLWLQTRGKPSLLAQPKLLSRNNLLNGRLHYSCHAYYISLRHTHMLSCTASSSSLSIFLRRWGLAVHSCRFARVCFRTGVHF